MVALIVIAVVVAATAWLIRYYDPHN